MAQDFNQEADTPELSDDTFNGMSDEDFLNMEVDMLGGQPADGGEAPAPEAAEETEEDPEAEEDAHDDGFEGPDDSAATNGDEDGDAGASDDTADDEADGSEGVGDGQEEVGEGDDGEGSGDAKDDKSADEIDYKAAYEKIFQPFKANGKEIQIDSVDDAVKLMQMGANYNKKMAALKPNLKTLKLLENNGLMSEEKLNYLIDLDKGNPEAIKKLVKDSGIDPLEMDLEKASEYRPENRTVDDRQLELDSVLDDIQDTPTYKQVVNVVSNEWDEQSRQTIGDHPQLLKVLNDHMANGIYDRIAAEVEKRRVLGRLNGLSALDAYHQVGDELNAKGAFNDLAQPQGGNAVADETPPQKPVPPKPDKRSQEEAKRKSKKRAASSTRTSPGRAAPQDLNPLSMSDDELEGLVQSRYL